MAFEGKPDITFSRVSTTPSVMIAIRDALVQAREDTDEPEYTEIGNAISILNEWIQFAGF